jgi:hypothetical protein
VTLQHLIGLALLVALVLGIWRHTKRHPLVAVAVACGVALVLRWAGSHPFPTIAGVAVGVAYWRSERVRHVVRVAGELVTIGWWFVSGLPDELRARSHTRRVQLRALRRILSNYRAGVTDGEKQVPTTALILLSPDDYEPFTELVGPLRDELQQELRERSHGYRVLGAPSISIKSDDTVRTGWPRVRVSFAAETTYDEAASPVEPTKVHTSAKYVADRPLAFGREAMFADIVADDRYVSRNHARYEHDGTSGWITDTRSMNGTFVNGIKIHGRHLLRHGDQLRLGRDVTFEFSEGEDTTPVKSG